MLVPGRRAKELLLTPPLGYGTHPETGQIRGTVLGQKSRFLSRPTKTSIALQPLELHHEVLHLLVTLHTNYYLY